MKLVDKVFYNKSFLTDDAVDDKEYKRLLAKAIEMIEQLSNDIGAKRVDELLDIINSCTAIEKKYIFADGVKFGGEVAILILQD